MMVTWRHRKANYKIGSRDFPTLWTEGLKSVLFKSWSRLDAGNYRGITILPTIEKIFETVVYHRISFANDAFNKKDKFNGGFRRGSRTADNIFFLQCMIQRQQSIGSNLVVCFVDFSKACDLTNRHILLKLMKGGWYGPVIDTLRNLYCKASYRIKSHYNDVTMGTISSQINSLTIVSQPFIRAQIKENIKAPRHWPLCGEFAGDSPNKWPVTRKMFPFDDVIMVGAS